MKIDEDLKELRRLADDADASSEVKWAGAAIAQKYDIKGICDPAYIANVIAAEIERVKADPDADVVARHWPGKDSATGLTIDDFIDYAEDADASTAAKAAAIRIVGSYATSIGQWRGKHTPDVMGHSVIDIAELIETYVALGGAPSEPVGPSGALETINRHRCRIGMGPLDPDAAGWTQEDVDLEAQRIARLNPNTYEALKRRLMR